MILLIDIGNSRIKIGLCKNPNTRNNIDVFYCENINKINSVLEKIYQYEFDTVLVSSVVAVLVAFFKYFIVIYINLYFFLNLMQQLLRL